MKIGIIGSGTMGSGIALAAIQNNYTVQLYDVREEAFAGSDAFIKKQMNKAVERGIISESACAKALELYSYSAALSSFADCDFIIEAVVERRDVKDALFAELESIVAPAAIIATNTSSIAITTLAASLQYPERFVGMHFFNPAHIMKLVEVIRGHKTSQTTIDKTVELAKALRKTPAIAADVPGFIVNRVARNYYNEAMRLCTEKAADIRQIDTIMKSAGFKMGPFELMDLIGIDTNFQVTCSVWEQYFYEPRFTPALMQKQYVEAKLHGRKTGEGFYSYKND